jgi:PKD repeat protein
VGSYTAVVTAANAVDVVTATTMVTITDIPITGLAAVNDSPTVLGQATTLTASVGTGSNVVYTWAFGDDGTGSGAVLSHPYGDVGTYVAIVTATNSVDVVTATTVVTITDVPVAGLALINDSPTPLSESTTLTASIESGSNVSYTLDFGYATPPIVGSLTPGVALPITHTYPAEGVYTATLTVSNTVGLLQATTVVTVVSVEPITGLQAHNDSPTTLGGTTTLSATVETGSGISYVWDFGEGTVGSGAVTTYVYPAVGTYTATVTATNMRGQATASTVVSVTAPSYAIYLPLVMRRYTSYAPDLVVTGITAERQGEVYAISVTVQNQGPRPVEYGNNFYVDLYIDREPEAFFIGDVSWGAQGDWFGVGESYTFITDTVTLQPGTHLLYAQADTDNTVIETAEANNTYGPITVDVPGVQQAGEEREIPPTPPPTGPRPTPTARP